MRIDSLQYANGRMKEYDLFFATRILFSRILRAFFVYNNITHKSRYKSRFICQCYKKKSRPPYLYGIGGLSV